MLLNSGPCSSSFSSSTDIDGQEIAVYPFDSNSEVHRLYWAGRLRVSIDLLLMKNHQSQLDLVLPPYPSLSPSHRSRSLFNILQDDRPPTTRVVTEEEPRFIAVDPKRPSRWPLQLVTKVGNKNPSKGAMLRGPAEREWESSPPRTTTTTVKQQILGAMTRCNFHRTRTWVRCSFRLN